MQNAWKAVTDEKCGTNWALFGYQGHTNTLALLAQGEDGIEELTEDLNPSKIMYAFLRVEDPKTSLPKYVILNWQVGIFELLVLLIRLFHDYSLVTFTYFIADVSSLLGDQCVSSVMLIFAISHDPLFFAF